MSLVSDLIIEVIDSSSDLSQVLRRARGLASELRSDELGTWAEAELNGYTDAASLPNYRVSVGSNLGSFVGSLGVRARGIPIPLSSLPEEWRESMSKLEIELGVAALQEILTSEEPYREAWAADRVAAMSQKILPEMSMINAWKPISKAKVAGILDAVRNRLLSFLLILREQHPAVQDAGANLQAIPKDDVRVRGAEA